MYNFLLQKTQRYLYLYIYISMMLIHVDSLKFGYNSVTRVTRLSHGSRPESDEEACLQGGTQARGKEQAAVT